MALARPKSNLTVDQLQDINKQLSNQEISAARPKTADSNRPFFRQFSEKPGETDLVYIPKHVVTDAEGGTHLREDKSYMHTVVTNNGRSFDKVRCVRGIVSPENGLDGTCPICDATSDAFELARLKVASQAAAQGLDPDNKDDETVRGIRRNVYGSMAVKSAEVYHTFPLCILETRTNGNRTGIVVDDEGVPEFKTVYYTVSDRFFAKSWAEAIESADLGDEEDAPEHIGGYVFRLSYGKKDEQGHAPSARDAARDLTISLRASTSRKYDFTKLDKATADWDPSNIQTVVYENMIYSVEDLKDMIAPVQESMQQEISLLQSGGNAALHGSSLDALTGGSPAKAIENTGLIDAADVDAPNEGTVSFDDDEDDLD